MDLYPNGRLSFVHIASDHDRSIDAWYECALVYVTGSYEEKYITGSM